MNDLSDILNQSEVGCIVNEIFINHMFYAEDSVLLAPSPCALQKLLNLSFEYAEVYELKFNPLKLCVWFSNLKV